VQQVAIVQFFKTKKNMKPYTQSEIKKATKSAMSIIYSNDNLMFGRKFKFDNRYRIGKLANKIIKETVINKTEILAKRKVRRLRKPQQFTNILTNPLCIDWRKNKADLRVNADHLMDKYSHRRHWAKSENDIKLLSILKKHIG
jgi:hypothetical protein